LHNNRIITLRQCERYLPASLETFTLANNNITDLNEMSHLANLKNVVNFSIANNPCVNMTGNSMYPFHHTHSPLFCLEISKFLYCYFLILIIVVKSC